MRLDRPGLSDRIRCDRLCFGLSDPMGSVASKGAEQPEPITPRRYLRPMWPPAKYQRWPAPETPGTRSWPLQRCVGSLDRKSTRLNSSHVAISYAVFCLKKKKIYYEGRL